MNEFQILLYVGAGLIVVVAIATIYLNSVKDDSSKRLVKMLEPFGVSYSTYKKATFATGEFDKIRGTINLTPSGSGKYLVKMRMRLDIPTLPMFSLATERTGIFLRKYAHEHTERWPRIGEGYFVKTPDASLAGEAIAATFSPATATHLDEFERRYEGVLIYKSDGTLFKKLDIELLRAVPELRNQHLILTHFYQTSSATLPSWPMNCVATC
jgi:hypothetical protein